MQNEKRHTAGGTGGAGAGGGRSSVERLPPAIRDAVAAAIGEDATIDEIVALIRAHGGRCSRSAVGRHVKEVRDTIRRQREADGFAETWARARGKHGESRTGLVAIETLRALAMRSIATLDERRENGEPVETKELASLALLLQRIEGAGRLRAEHERAAALAAAERARPPALKPGLSPEAVAAIRLSVEGPPQP